MVRCLDEFMLETKQLVEKQLMLPEIREQVPPKLYESMVYSLQAGGKRLRPILMFASASAYVNDTKKIVKTALALEMIHTYSLIHDDLPAMDNDDLRRGKPTNHKAFDEATAILAGDALLTEAFGMILGDDTLKEPEKLYVLAEIQKRSGACGMVAGQMLDMEAEGKSLTLQELEEIHRLKTGDLIVFAVKAGAYLGGATQAQIDHLEQFASYLGLIFQIQDDILDVIGDEETLGKPVGSDEGNDKNTYTSLLGLDGAIEQKNMYVQKAKSALKAAGAEDSRLMGLIDHFSMRDH